MVSVRWGHWKGLGGEGGRQERSSGPNNPVQPDTRLAGGTIGGDMQVGGVQFPEHRPTSAPTLPQPPPFPKRKGTGAPLALVLLSSKSPPPLNTPPPQIIKFVKKQPSVLGIS